MKKAPAIEYESAEDVKAYHQTRLKEALMYLHDRSPFYQRMFAEHKINPTKINIYDLSLLPFTTKDDLGANNDDFLCVPKNKVADYVTTSGTTSAPITIYLTSKDLQRLAYNEQISLECTGASSGDIFQLMTTMDKQFMAGLAYWMGIREMKAGIVRVGPGSPYLQWESIKRFSPSVLIAIPSFIPKLIQYAVENGIDHKATNVKSIVCIGEPLRNPDFSLNELGKRISSLWDVSLFSTYASTEMGSAFTECGEGKGGHHHPELLILEVIDEEGKQVQDGELGEVVVTTLGVEGIPLLRYKTGDLCHVHYATCGCGRTSARLGPLVGRKQHMIKYKGTTLFPQVLFDVLDAMKSIDLYQIEVTKDEFRNDDVCVFLPSDLQSEAFEHALTAMFKARLRVTPHVRFINREELSKRVINQDKRKSEKIIYF